MAEIKYEVVEHIGVLSESAKGWKKELNRVSWNDTGAVATATLLELGKAANLKEAVKMAKIIREKINVRDELMSVLEEKYQ